MDQGKAHHFEMKTSKKQREDFKSFQKELKNW